MSTEATSTDFSTWKILGELYDVMNNRIPYVFLFSGLKYILSHFYPKIVNFQHCVTC